MGDLESGREEIISANTSRAPARELAAAIAVLDHLVDRGPYVDPRAVELFGASVAYDGQVGYGDALMWLGIARSLAGQNTAAVTTLQRASAVFESAASAASPAQSILYPGQGVGPPGTMAGLDPASSARLRAGRAAEEAGEAALAGGDRQTAAVCFFRAGQMFSEAGQTGRADGAADRARRLTTTGLPPSPFLLRHQPNAGARTVLGTATAIALRAKASGSPPPRPGQAPPPSPPGSPPNSSRFPPPPVPASTIFVPPPSQRVSASGAAGDIAGAVAQGAFQLLLNMLAPFVWLAMIIVVLLAGCLGVAYVVNETDDRSVNQKQVCPAFNNYFEFPSIGYQTFVFAVRDGVEDDELGRAAWFVVNVEDRAPADLEYAVSVLIDECNTPNASLGPVPSVALPPVGG